MAPSKTSSAKPKQQKTLLSFFSPPAARTAAKEPSTRKISASEPSKRTLAMDKIKQQPKKAKKDKGEAVKTEDFAATTKRIEFSPIGKNAGRKEGRKTGSDASQTKTRRAYEEFLGTSSDEEDDVKARKLTGKRSQKPDKDVEEKKTTPLKRLRKSSVRIVDDDDDDEEEVEAEHMEVDKSGKDRGKRMPLRTKSAPRKTNVVSSEEETEESTASGDESGSEFGADDASESGDDDEDDDEDMEEEDEEEEVSEEEERPKKKRRVQSTPSKRPAPSFLSPPARAKISPTPASSATKSPRGSATSTATIEAGDGSASGVCGAGSHIHDTLPFLHEKRRDINGNAPESKEFDSRTLFVPPDFFKKETPAMTQWWEIKSRNMDTILFFKVGKFYELFHMDADVGFKELGLIYMKGDKAHSGFPEIAYGKMSSQLIEKGYRVARIEQTETPEMLKVRNSKSSTKAKVVRREMCAVLSIGTNTMSFLDAPITASQDQVSRFLMAIKELVDLRADTIRYGVCLVDCATGAFHLAEFDDTEQRDRLKTLFAQFDVVEVVGQRHGLCADTKMVIRHAAPYSTLIELAMGKEFWNASTTIEEIVRAGYFDEHGWPESVQAFLNDDRTVNEEGQLVISALGGCIWHLRRCVIDQELLSLCNFKRYKPSDEEAREQREAQGSSSSVEAELRQQYVVLDSQTIQNLEVLSNNHNGSRAGSLIATMDKTVTPFGKRLLQEWVLKPLCKVAEINERLDAVDELGQSQDLLGEVRELLRKLPDLERLLSRIHALGSVHRSQDHPDSRAIMYEATTYNVRKIRDFLSVLGGFDAAMSMIDQVAPRFSQFHSPLLQMILKKRRTQENAEGYFPDLLGKLEFFKKSFDQAKAAKSGVIVPKDGVDPDYDQSRHDIQDIQRELDEYLQEQKTRLKCKQISYWGTKKEDRFQLEVPEGVVQSKQPKDYELKSRKKGYKRFHTPEIRDMLARLTSAEERSQAALKDQMRRVFHKFDEDYKFWMKAVQCLAVLDCLLSLALVSSQSEGYVRPEVVSAALTNDGVPFIHIEEGFHPCVAATFDSGEFIPNSTSLGENGSGRMMLLSGPNMGGKSTLLRQTCVIALMAQVGCFVPASSCRLTPVDRIFTRIGASDRILAGQSTLYVELAETATILNHASRHSLVILDELGRGTSTFDGTAIAYAVVEHLLKDTQCRGMFATHYHSLIEEYLDDQKVCLGHMGCMVDPENDKKVTFLYKLEDGICPKSYGLNVAMLAKLPEEVVELAATKSEQFEQSLQATSHAQLEASTLLQRVQRCLKQEPVDFAELKGLWSEAQRLIK